MSERTRRELFWILAILLASIPVGYVIRAYVNEYVRTMPLIDNDAAWRRRRK